MNRSMLTRLGSLVALFLGIVALGSFVIFGATAQQTMRSTEMKSSASATMTFTASVEPTDPLSRMPISSATVDAATLRAMSIRMMTMEPPDPSTILGWGETQVVKRATYFAEQSTYAANYNRTAEKFATMYVQTPIGMRTPASYHLVTQPPPVDYSTITPIVVQTFTPISTSTRTPTPIAIARP